MKLTIKWKIHDIISPSLQTLNQMTARALGPYVPVTATPPTAPTELIGNKYGPSGPPIMYDL